MIPLGLFVMYGVLMLTLGLIDERRRSLPWIVNRARITEAQEHENTASDRVARVSRGPFKEIPYAHRDGTSIDAHAIGRHKWAQALLTSDDRTRKHNKQRALRRVSIRIMRY